MPIRKIDRTVQKNYFWHQLCCIYEIIGLLAKALWAIIKRRFTVKAERWETEPEFSIKIMNTLNSGFLSVQICLGTELGLFDHLGKLNERPCSSEEIAASLDLKERYVREWLDCMVTAKIVETDMKNSVYWLPNHRAQTLSSEGRPYLMKLMKMDMDLNMLQAFVAMFTVSFDVYADLKDCFKNQGAIGLGYEKFTQLDKWMGIINTAYYNNFFFSKFVPSLPKNLRQKLGSGLEYLDLGCAIGVPGRMLAQQYANSKFYGVDFNSWSIGEAKRESVQQGVDENTEFLQCDAAKLPTEWTSKFDWLTAFSCIHDLSYPEKALEECLRVLKPGGYLSLMELYCHSNAKYNTPIPNATMMYSISLFYCMSTSLSQEGATGLGTCWGSELAEQMIKEAGFVDVKFERLTDSPNVHILARKPE